MGILSLFLLSALSLPFSAATSDPNLHPLFSRSTFAYSDFDAASWIWLPQPKLASTAAPGTVGLMRTFNSPVGKTAFGASIAVTADNNFTLWVNGHAVGASQDSWANGQALVTSLNATTNTIAALAVNYADSTATGPTSAGFLAFVRIFYSDGTNSTLVSDKDWKATGIIPPDWPLPKDTSKFVNAEVAFKYGGGPWGKGITITQTDLSSADLKGSNWIWSTPDAAAGALAGSVGFRKSFTSPPGKAASSAIIVASADNFFQLYVNGRYVSAPARDPNTAGSATAWQFASRVTVPLSATTNTFNFLATNFLAADGKPSSAGFIGVIQIVYADGSTATIRTDSSWLAVQTNDAVAFNAMPDSAFAPAASLGVYGMGPWGGGLGVADTVDAERIFLSGNNVGSGIPISVKPVPSGIAVSANINAPIPSFSFTQLPEQPSDGPTVPGASAASRSAVSIASVAVSVFTLLIFM
ncbi:hypothetical protein MIND_00808200 [Mycena indigotica]|uniref:Uncharacterized protein n=1 Tax=Mycena indigotica TaxID=2126181 RepID=A0A8H6SFK7_9AGAR|nr:uncharacterized protein MIND_00808200 [Mycena indigotica]KAF7298611.1 hypothetical protein MIND_00808200 [Mycena indigotica]